MLLGIVGVTGMETLLILAVQWTSMSNLSLLNVAPWPIFSALLAPLFVRDFITRRMIVGGFLAFAGVCCVLISGGSKIDFSESQMWGNWLV